MTKKVKRTISLIIAAIMLLSTMSVLAFANKLPTYGEATDKEVGPHDHVTALAAEDLFNEDGILVNKAGQPLMTEDKAAYAQPTCTKGGAQEFVVTCSVCGAELNRVKYSLEPLKSHVAADKFTIENVKQPTCAKPGSYNEVVRCKFCNKVISTTKVIVKPTGAHVPALPVKEQIKEATCAATGSYYSVVYCKNCDQELQRTYKVIPKLTYHISNTNYVNGETRTCADGEDRCVICNELLRPAIPHVWDKGTETKAPGMNKPGEMTFKCLIANCGATMKEAIPATGKGAGDVNGDGKVNTADARLVLRFAVGLGDFDKVISKCCTDDSFVAADADENGKIEPADARLILRTAVGLPN